MLKFFSLFLVVSLAHCQNGYDENTYFSNSADLSKDVNLKWNFTTEDIYFKLVVNTNGWVGFGLSPNGDMANSDTILAWTNPDGTIQFKDSHTFNRNVWVDTVEHWKRLFYTKANGKTTVIFTRKLKICPPASQPANETNINVEPTAYVIYAFGTNFRNNFPAYHGTSRGSKSLPLLVPNEKVQLQMSQIEEVEFVVDLTLPNDRVTTYWCQMFKIPNDWISIKRHLVRTETIMNEQTVPYNHHWLMYECPPEFDAYLVNNTIPEPQKCSDGSLPWVGAEKICNKISMGWAVGGELQTDFPPKLAYPIGGGPKEFKYFYLQMHYENPNLDKDVKIHSGAKWYATRKYREIEFGIFTGGTVPADMGIIIPPKASALSLEYMCRENSFRNIFGPSGEITIFAHSPHTHLAGTQVFSKVVRNGTEVEYIANNKYYSFNHQYVNFLTKPVTMRKGDEFIMNCVYQTNDRTDFSLGGLASHDEMCFNFVWYYPRNIDFASCLDFPALDQWGELFGTLNSVGLIDWQYKGVVQNLLTDGLSAIRQSPLMNQPERLESIFKEFYVKAKRYETTKGVYDFSSWVPVGAINVTRLVEPPCTLETTKPTQPTVQSTSRPTVQSTSSSRPISTAQRTTTSANSFDERSEFANSIVLDYLNLVKVDWNYTKEDITFRITIKTSGWLGFGLSPNGKMWNSNMFLVWTKPDGSVEFREASAVFYNVMYDSTKNWRQIFYRQANGVTTVIATRKNKIPASMAGTSNVDVGAQASNVVYAWGNGFDDKKGGVPTYHYGNRGSGAIALLSGKQ